MPKAFTCGEVMSLVDRLAPFRLAEPWDNVGLQLGDPRAPARRVAVALETTPDIVRQVRRRRADVLIVHHPLFFKPIKSVTRQTPAGAMALDLIAARVALIAAHTNLDASPCGTNAAAAERLGLRRVAPYADLDPRPAAACKFVVFVPQGHERAIMEAIARGGGGLIGAYDHCSFRSLGIGAYRPQEGAHPFAGQPGRLEEAEEWRIEAEVPRAALAKVLREARAVHPYEEMAYDVYPRERADPGFSMGVVGELPRPASLGALTRRLKRLLPGGDPAVFVGDARRPVAQVAVFTGAGAAAIEAWRGQAGALITGEITHHAAREAEARGIAVIAAGHFATEQPVAAFFAKHLQRAEEIRQNHVEVFALERIKSPFKG